MSIRAGQDNVISPTRVSAGLALIELIVVIMIILILAGFALPRVRIDDTATPAAATRALGRELRTAAARAHATWLGQNQPGAIEMDGRLVRVPLGYPDLETVDDALPSLDGFRYDAATGTFVPEAEGPAVLTACMVRYSPPTAKGEAPGVAIITDGC